MPATEVGSTVTVDDTVAEGQTPLVTTALYINVELLLIEAAGRIAEVNPAIFVKVPPSEANCHCIVPVLPVKVKSAGVLAWQILGVGLLIFPAIESGSTFTTIGIEVAEPHGPLETFAW